VAAAALLAAIPLAAASGPAGKTNNNVTKTTAVRTAWSPETLTGRITMVDPGRNVVVIVGQDGVPFDMVVTPKTRIQSGGHALTLQDLAGDTNMGVSVKFTPERRGDVATSIHIGG
jgi:hypothetical protein